MRRENFTDKFIENFKKWFQCMWLNVTPSHFFSRTFRSEALVYNSYFVFRTAERNYSTLDSHTNTIISHAVAYS